MKLFSPNDERSVSNTKELARIRALPIRHWEDGAEEWAIELTEILKTPNGEQTLRPVQAKAIYEAAVNEGASVPVRVGGGKTLIAFLVFYVTSARRPLLLVPAKLKQATMRHYRELSKHWKIPNYIRIESYEMLGRTGMSDFLEQYRPDVVVADEGHKLANIKGCAGARRMKRFKDHNPTCIVVVESGTFTKRSIKDYAHLIGFTHKPLDRPIPNPHQEMQEWSDALDQKTIGDNCRPGALAQLCPNIDNPTLQQIREAYGERLASTFGVVSTREGFEGASLTIDALRYDATSLDPVFEQLQSWILPNGEEIPDALSWWAASVQLAQGFYYTLRTPAPVDWKRAKKEWHSAARKILGNNRRNLDSLKQVVDHIDYYPEAKDFYEAWKKIEPTFVPDHEPRWVSDCAIQACLSWGSQRLDGVIWTEHIAFGEELERVSGWPFFRNRGLDKRGRFVEDEPGGIVIVSRASNDEGRNLQHRWSQNLIVHMPPNGKQIEQILGRTHRDGQKEDEVTCDILLACLGQAEAFYRAKDDAVYVEATFRQAQKILYADSNFPTIEEIMKETGPRWE